MKNGRVLAVAQARTKRAKGRPTVPTMQEEVYEGFGAATWYGLVGPGKFAAFIRSEQDKWDHVVREGNVKADS